MAAVGPTFIGSLQDGGMSLATPMPACIAAAGLVVILLVWLGPETRGRNLKES